MDWLDADEVEGEFVDADRIWRALDAVARAPRLAAVAAARFLTGLAPSQLIAPEDSTEGSFEGPGRAHPITASLPAFGPGSIDLPADAADPADDEALAFLLREGFVEVPVELRNDIERFRRHEEQAGPRRLELEQVYRRARLLALQTRRNERELATGSGLFKRGGKEERWEQASKRDRLKLEIDELALSRRRLEGEIEKAGNLLRSLLDRINRDEGLRENGRWAWDRPVSLTYDGRFLLAYLDEMNTENFRGRPLAEILQIGASLA